MGYRLPTAILAFACLCPAVFGKPQLADRVQALLPRVQNALKYRFRRPPRVALVDQKTLTAAIRIELLGRKLGAGGSLRVREEAITAAAALSRVLPVWLEICSGRVLICRENFKVLSAISGSKVLRKRQGRDLFLLYGLVQAAHCEKFGFPLGMKAIATADQGRSFDALRWGYAWLMTERIADRLDWQKTIAAGEEALKRMAAWSTPGVESDPRAERIRAQYDLLRRRGVAFITTGLAKGRQRWLEELMRRPVIDWAHIRHPARFDFGLEQVARLAGVEWALHIYSLSVDTNAYSKVTVSTDPGPRLTGLSRARARLILPGIRAHRAILRRHRDADFQEMGAALTVFSGPKEARNYYRCCPRLRDREWARLVGRRQFRDRLHWSSLSTDKWEGTMGSCFLVRGRERNHCVEICACRDNMVLEIRERGVLPNPPVMKRICEQMFKAVAAGGPRFSPPGSRVATFDDLRRSGRVDFSDLNQANRAKALVVGAAFNSRRGVSSEGYRISPRFHAGSGNWCIQYRGREPEDFFAVIIDLDREVVKAIK